MKCKKGKLFVHQHSQIMKRCQLCVLSCVNRQRSTSMLSFDAAHQPYIYSDESADHSVMNDTQFIFGHNVNAHSGRLKFAFWFAKNARYSSVCHCLLHHSSWHLSCLCTARYFCFIHLLQLFKTWNIALRNTLQRLGRLSVTPKICHSGRNPWLRLCGALLGDVNLAWASSLGQSTLACGANLTASPGIHRAASFY